MLRLLLRLLLLLLLQVLCDVESRRHTLPDAANA
jgi:hypothetical protein